MYTCTRHEVRHEAPTRPRYQFVDINYPASGIRLDFGLARIFVVFFRMPLGWPSTPLPAARGRDRGPTRKRHFTDRTMSFSTHASVSRVSIPPRALGRDTRGDARLATPRRTRTALPALPRHRGGSAPRARVAEAAAGGDAASPVIVGVGSAGVHHLASIAAFPSRTEAPRTRSKRRAGATAATRPATARLGPPAHLTSSRRRRRQGHRGRARGGRRGYERDRHREGKSSPFTYIIVDGGRARRASTPPGPTFPSASWTTTPSPPY